MKERGIPVLICATSTASHDVDVGKADPCPSLLLTQATTTRMILKREMERFGGGLREDPAGQSHLRRP